MIATLAPIDRQNAPELCAQRLRKAILEGEFPAGSRLPPERKLAELFGVNRVTVRSALTRLEAEHLLHVRQGSGYRVRDYKKAAGPDLIGALLDLAKGKVAADIVADLLLLRRSLARAMFERMAERGVGDLDPVHEAIDELERQVKEGAGFAEIAQADLDVVAALVDASGSAVVRLCFNPVATVLGRLPRLQKAMFRAPERNVASWRLVVSWLEAGRADLVVRISDELKRFDDATLRVLEDVKED